MKLSSISKLFARILVGIQRNTRRNSRNYDEINHNQPKHPVSLCRCTSISSLFLISLKDVTRAAPQPTANNPPPQQQAAQPQRSERPNARSERPAARQVDDSPVDSLPERAPLAAPRVGGGGGGNNNGRSARPSRPADDEDEFADTDVGSLLI